MALSETEKYEESNEYLEKAESIYSFDPAFEEIRDNNEKGLSGK